MTAVLIGLALALAAAVSQSGGFLCQHLSADRRPPVTVRRPIRTLRAMWSSGWWRVGLLLAGLGFALHLSALALAPISLVQAFVAGGLALAVPLAARFLFDVAAMLQNLDHSEQLAVRTAEFLDDSGERHRLRLGRKQLEHVEALFERRSAVARIVFLHLAPSPVHVTLLCITPAGEHNKNRLHDRFAGFFVAVAGEEPFAAATREAAYALAKQHKPDRDPIVFFLPKERKLSIYGLPWSL